MCAVVFVSLSFHTLGKEYLTTGRVTFGFEVIKTSFVHLDKAIFIWSCCFASACALFFIFKVWLNLRTCAGGLATGFDWFGLLCLASYYFYNLKLVTDAIRYFNFNFSCILIITLEQFRFLMKVHAFVRSKASEELPRLSFSNYLYFLFAPTLIYRDAYPRTNHINWKFVAQCLLECVAGFFVFTFCIVNSFPSSERCAEKFTVNEVLLEIVEIIGYAAIMLVCPFFTLFHSFQNFFAEILQFGDRLFYLDWWNEHTVNGWLLKNDKIVQDWLYYYVYRDFRKHICDDVLLAKLTVFLLSLSDFP
ncbi:sterol O-acyltransferase 2-like [Zophobas morio]|uniref:sterol O-acyltransferase 2-like n=1 Tax=Zophobas morio TaxID=2755281 RepID=UPI00308376BC